MDNEIKTWLFDIIQSIEEIESYFAEQPKMFETYIKDRKLNEPLKGILRSLERQQIG